MSTPQKLVIITGPTATGKSSLALELAQKFNGEVISADSRQIYSGMDIGTGKNLPRDAVKKTSSLEFNSRSLAYYQVNEIAVWGYDLVAPSESFSVSEYLNFVSLVLEEIGKKQKLPIVVGGTNFYIQSLLNPPETISVPPNSRLRQKLETLSVKELQRKLAQVNPQKLESMNNSDCHNPRRLVRAIEVSQEPMTINPQVKLPSLDVKAFGLIAPVEIIAERIRENVLSRATDEFTQEVNRLTHNHDFWQTQAASATGYKVWFEFLQGAISKETAIELWLTEEVQYAKRQITWLKKQRLELVDITKLNFQLHIEEALSAW